MDNKLFSKLAAIPILILFLGAGLLLGRVALDWSPEDTQYVLGGLLTICGGSLGVVGITFGLFAGAAFYRKLQAGREPDVRVLRPSRRGRSAPLLLHGPEWPEEDDQEGSWYSPGPQAYDLWPEEQEQAWREQR